MTCKLIASTFTDFTTTGIPYDAQPQLFKDAIEFTRKLSIRYLWIDSLCIIQSGGGTDSEEENRLSGEDWKKESAKMCSVYANSYLTLAAASASSCHDSLFSTIRTVEVKGT